MFIYLLFDHPLELRTLQERADDLNISTETLRKALIVLQGIELEDFEIVKHTKREKKNDQ